MTARIDARIRARLFRKLAVLLPLALAVVLTQAGQAQAQNPPLKFFNNFFLPGGDYEVAGVGLEGQGDGSGLATGMITIAGVPTESNVVAAFLYAQVVSADGADAGMAGATFQAAGVMETFALSSPDGPLGQVLNPSGTAPCWSSGGGTGGGGVKRTYNYRFDILRTFNVVDGGPQVNGTHTVQLPDLGTSNSTPRALGASVVVVYSVPTEPLNAVVIYDGGYTMNNDTDSMVQTIEGFYDPASGPGKMTHILGSAQANKSEILYFSDGVTEGIITDPAADPTGTNPFRSAQGASWDNLTFVTLSAIDAQVTTRVDHAGFNSFDCLTWGAIIYRPAGVNDSDEDGIPDLLETTGGLTDPEGQPLPNLYAMGASLFQKDLFVEIGALEALPGTTYGPLTYGVCEALLCEEDSNGHNHRPDPAVLKMVADALWCGGSDPCIRGFPPNTNLNGISVHFDVGPGYKAFYESMDGVAEMDIRKYIVPGIPDPEFPAQTLARGGESILETACVPDHDDDTSTDDIHCQFPDYPGTISFKIGYQLLRDAPVAFDGGELTLAEQDANEAACLDAQLGDPLGLVCRRRFDRVRKDIFHYALFAHARGKPKAICLNDDDSPNLDCALPGFHVPSSASGIGDLPGADLMVTLGFWGFDFVGSEFVQASTFMHELGHNLDLWHGGFRDNTNCNPNYLSVMNYLFQAGGLRDDFGVAHLNYSGEVLPLSPVFGKLNEFALSDGFLGNTDSFPYRTAWYAPVANVPFGSEATKFCNGVSFEDPPLIPMARVDSPSALNGYIRVSQMA